MMKTAETERSLTTEIRPLSRSALVACGAALLPLLLAVSCTTSDAQDSSASASHTRSTLDAAFLARAEHACTRYTRYNSTHYFAVSGFNRFVPDRAELPRVATFLGHNPAYRTLGPDLEKLGPPDTGSAAWSALMDDLRISSELMKNEIGSAHRGDVGGFMRYDARLTKNTADVQADLGKLGLSGASSCYGIQGDPLLTAPHAE
jgi:hypothetical protein